MKYAEELGMAPSKNFVPRREMGPKRKPFGRPRSGGPSRSGERSFSGGSRGNDRGGFGGGSRGGKRNIQEMHVDISKLVNKAKPLEEEVFVPKHAFADFAIDAQLKENIAKKGYVAPTPIQDESIPHVLAGKDIVGLANTGTGKTAAFLIPLIDKVLKFRALGKQERVLIMVPNREHVLASKMAHAIDMARAALTRKKRAETISRRWQRRVKYYERAIAAAAARATGKES
jgi:hypothetical protein